jgi:GAF domain-containing protein
MSATPTSTFSSPEQLVAALQRRLVECKAERDLAKRNLNEATTERDAAMAREAATAEVLRVINSSPGDLAPVFDAILDKAHALCGAAFGGLMTFDGESFRVVAAHGDPDFVQYWQQGPIRPPEGTPLARVMHGEAIVYIPDAIAEESYLIAPAYARIIDLGGVRTFVSVPLRKDDALLGVITAYRQEVRPFADKQIALLQNFAAQAVIAMENARLITETREALEQQTATAEVLQVINSSPGDLAPVFDAMLEKALHLGKGHFGGLFIREGDRVRAVATRGLPDRLNDYLRQGFSGSHRLAGAEVEHIADLLDDPSADRPARKAAVELGGARTMLSVALRKDDTLFGYFSIFRQEVRPFTDKQIALLQNFAAQAVIAMENARLLTETREALEQQTATAEVSQVINSSPGDLGPVFDAILEKAHTVCAVSIGGLALYDRGTFLWAASRGYPQTLVERLRQGYSPNPSHPMWRLVEGEPYVHVNDLAKIDDPTAKAVVELAGIRTTLFLALRRDKTFLGMITAARDRVAPFSEKEIALLQNFAAQAVIAMENARLLTETREALEQQTATAEVLQVINSSPGDLAPVFDAILEKALSLCEAAFGSLVRFDGEAFDWVAARGVPETWFAEFTDSGYRPAPGLALYRFQHGGEDIEHVADIAADETGRSAIPDRRRFAELSGARTAIWIALRKDRALRGALVIYRREVRPFSEKQIALLQNFAAQAVIAMENAGLLTETREALEQQTATAEVLQVINTSPGDLAPVFDAILEKARAVCGFAQGSLNVYDGEYFRTVATHGIPEPFAEVLRQPRRTGPQARFLNGDRIVHITDAAAEGSGPDDPVYRAATEAGVRTVLFVPLRNDQRLFGYITANRREVRPFSEKEIALLENFAAQAVIAMENARLLTETHEALEQQTATAEVLQVINSSPGNLAPVFDAMLDKALRLCEGAYGNLLVFDGRSFSFASIQGEPGLVEHMRRRGPFEPMPGTAISRIVEGEDVAHIADLLHCHEYHSVPQFRELVDTGGYRSMLEFALRKDKALLGVIAIFRRETKPFSEKQIALLRNFAAQAVIAMENARLLTETREALDQQTATAEVLQVINSSPGDLAPVFDAMLERAMRLCEAAFGVLWTFEGEIGQVAALRGVPPAFAEFLTRGPHRETSSTANNRLRRGENVVQIADSEEDDAYRSGEPVRRAMVELGGARTMLAVPLRKDGTLLGSFIIYRQEVRPFADKQIALLQNFAAQAVIAMENARLLDEIRQRQQELRVTFDNMVDGVAMFDETLHLAAWNRNFQELLQLPDEVLAQRPDLDTYIRHLVERGEFGETDPETQIARLRARIGDHYSFERTRPDGTVIEIRHNPMPGGGLVLIYSDITERIRSEAEIKAARDAAEAAYHDLKAAQANLIQAEKMASLGQLTAGIAHEIKNPLNFVNNFAGLGIELLDELKEIAAPAVAALDDERRAEIDETIDMLSGNLDKIAEHGRRADNIVTSMLEHSRGSSGERRSVDLNALVEEALNLAYHGGRAQDQCFNITLERDYADMIAPLELVPQDITRVCLNLFGNGFYAATQRQRQAADAGFQPTLKVSTRDLGEAVEIRVRDNGIGIPPEIKDKLFQPFFTTKPSGEGTGLGLSISYDIVTQQHGGTITVDSRVGEFTEFTVRLPRAYRATTAEAAS